MINRKNYSFIIRISVFVLLVLVFDVLYVSK